MMKCLEEGKNQISYMRTILIFIGIVAYNVVFGQHYYIVLNGDTANCEILKEEPYSIKIKSDDSKKDWISAKEMKGYISSNGVFMESKRIINKNKKDTVILLPQYRTDRKYTYTDSEVSMVTGNGVTFYELRIYEKPKVTIYLNSTGGMPTGRRSWLETYIENDSVGLSKVNYLTNPDEAQQKLDAINSVYFYLMGNKDIEKKLSVYGDYRNFTEKGLKKLIAEFIGKKLN